MAYGDHNKVSVGGDRRSVTVTFDYQGDLRTVVAPSRKAAFAEASARWGWGWDGEPVVSSPWSIYSDITGRTKARHGQDLNQKEGDARKRDHFRRTSTSYNDR